MLGDIKTAIVKLIQAFNTRSQQKHQQQQLLRTRQQEIFSEGYIVSTLREQLQAILFSMQEDSGIQSVTFKVTQEAYPYLMTVAKDLQCDIVELPHLEFILTRKDMYV